MREEAGFDIAVHKLAAVLDRARYPHVPPRPFHVYKMFFICEIVGGEPRLSSETTEIDFFPRMHCRATSLCSASCPITSNGCSRIIDSPTCRRNSTEASPQGRKSQRMVLHTGPIGHRRGCNLQRFPIMSFLANRLARVKPSPTMAITALATELKAAGARHHQPVGRRTRFRYAGQYPRGRHRGDRAGRDALYRVRWPHRAETRDLRKVQARERARLQTSQITVSSGGKQVSVQRDGRDLSPGDEVVIPAPYWVSYPEMVLLCDGEPVPVACPQNNGFKMRPEDLEAAITPKTKWLILNSPSNPTGAAYTEPTSRRSPRCCSITSMSGS